MNDKVIQTLVGLKNTIQMVEIRGKHNWDMLSGCVNAIDNLLKELTTENVEQKVGENNAIRNI